MAEAVKRTAHAAGRVVRDQKFATQSSRVRGLSQRMLIGTVAIYDIMALVGSGFIAQFLYFRQYMHATPPLQDYLAPIMIAALIFHLFARENGQYSNKRVYDLPWQLSSLAYLCLATFGATFVVLFFLKTSANYSRVWFAGWAFSFVALLAIGRGLFARHVDHLLRSGVLRKSVAIIGSGKQFHAVRDVLIEDQPYYQIVDAVDLSGDAPDGVAGEDVSADAASSLGLRHLIAEAQDKHLDEVIIALPASEGARLEAILRKVQALPVDIQIVPDFGGATIPFMHLRHAGGVPLLTTVSKPISDWGAFLKRAEDFIIASIGLILALPGLLVIAALIKLDSKGPVFFRQRRHGYNHQVIEVFKFRSMTVMEDGDQVTQATKADKRVTRLGRILRRTSLDELPQLINVLRGEMSIVGPRPHALAHNTYYGALVENYANRHRVKPGITGWAQVHGLRGETENAAMMAERVKYDLQYIENWSIGFDLKIIVMTPLFGLFRRAY